jgi:hypothetical protein
MKILQRWLNPNLLISFALGYILFVSGCTLVSVKFPGDPLPMEELNIRMLTRDFARQFAQSVEVASDQIRREASDPRVQTNALRWKINAVAEVQESAFLALPTVAMIDTWVLCVQMSFFFSEGNGQNVFDRWQSAAIDMADGLKNEIERLARSVASEDAFERYRQFVYEYARLMPIENMSFYRKSVITKWAEFEGKEEEEIMATVGSGPEVLENFVDRMAFYERTVPKRAQWFAELYMIESGMGSRIDQQMASLNSNATDLVRNTQNALVSFSRVEQRLVQLADESPELINDAINRVKDDIVPALSEINAQWLSTIDFLEQFNRQWELTLASISDERTAMIKAFQQERLEVMRQLDELSQNALERSWRHLKTLVTSLAGILVVCLILVIGMPFAMGFITGRATAKKTA